MNKNIPLSTKEVKMLVYALTFVEEYNILSHYFEEDEIKMLCSKILDYKYEE